MAQKELTKPAEIYELRVTLLDIKPPVWRRVAVPSDITLAKLHKVIQILFFWTDSHLHEFRCGDMICAMPDPDYDAPDVVDDRRVKLNEVMDKPGDRIVYCYDFGDDWQHRIDLKRIEAPLPDKKYPVCLEGARACPPEDCGGPPGYENFLRALADPKHEEHELYTDWIGGEFDPEAFDISGINAELRKKFRK